MINRLKQIVRNSKPLALLSVSNDIVTDNRLHKVSLTLRKFGYKVLLTGRKLPSNIVVSEQVDVEFARFRMLFNKKVFFYAELNFRLFFYILRKRPAILVSNDMDTLPAHILAGKLLGIKVFFDSHEYFSESPELENRDFVKGLWKRLEDIFIPQAYKIYTVSNSIAETYKKLYQKDVYLVRNLPLKNVPVIIPESPLLLGQNKIIIYQGVLNVGRGIELMIDAMKLLPNYTLLVIGGGDISKELHDRAKHNRVLTRIVFTGKISFTDLPYYTRQAYIGLSLEEDMGLNYQFSLPNKIFDYIQANVPLLVSNLPEMAKLVKEYAIGDVLYDRTPQALANIITKIADDKESYSLWKQNLIKAADDLCWEKQEEMLHSIYFDK